MKGSREMFDVLRTLALLALSGVRPSNRGAGLQFRRFAKIIADKYYLDSWETVCRYYFSYWKGFLPKAIPEEDGLASIYYEVGRFLGTRMSEELKLPPVRTRETIEEYAIRMVYNQGVNPDRIREFLGT